MTRKIVASSLDIDPALPGFQKMLEARIIQVFRLETKGNSTLIFHVENF